MKPRVGLVLLLTVSSLLFFVGSPSADEKAEKTEKAALASSAKWLVLVDKGDYSKSYEQAARIFKTLVTRLEWQSKLDTFRKPLGNVSERNTKSKQYTKTLPDAPEGDYFVIQYETAFTNKQTVTETVTATLEKDGKWKVAGYYITFPGQTPQPPAEEKKQ